MTTLLTIELAAVTGGAANGRKRFEVLPRSGVYFSESPAEHACIAKNSRVGTQLTDREIGLKCGLGAKRATAYSNAVQRAQDAIDP
jgi:hypothetical protein